ncbi:MAG: hypothetical protein AAF939_21155, partial [Planctomycetota bacterium]
MKSVFVFEWLTGGGLWRDQVLPESACSTQAQGQKMWRTICTDFAEAGCRVLTTLDNRIRLP